jgi:hypothetical protein
VCRTGRGEALCSGGWCAVQPESMVENITDGEGAIAGCGEQLADALLDLTRGLGTSISVITSASSELPSPPRWICT